VGSDNPRSADSKLVFLPRVVQRRPSRERYVAFYGDDIMADDAELAIRSASMSLLYLSLLAIATTGVFAGSLEQRPTRPLLKAQIKDGWERWTPDVPVGGSVRVGVMRVTTEPINPRVLFVHLPSTDKRPPVLCVEISSQDGRYSAALPYDIRNQPADTVSLELPTSHAQQLASYPPSRIAILASVAERCDAEPSAFVAASWHDTTTTSKISVFLNSRLPTSLIDQSVPDGREISCDTLENTTTAYNLRCDIPADPSASENYVIRMRRNGRITRVALPLRLR
jgi:hypothetical protein